MDKSAFEALGFLPVIMGGLSLFLSVPTIVALCTARAVAKGLRMYLLNILMSEILINGSAILTGLIALVTVFSAAPAPPPLLCRFIIWVINICQLARCFSVVGFSLMVLVIVRYGYKNIKIMYIIASLCVVWGVSVLLTIQYQVPQVYAVGFFAGAVCFPVRDDTIFLEARVFFTVLFLFVTTLLPLVVCIAVPIIVFRYTKKHSITGGIDYGKAAAKLCLFLLTGTLMNSTVTIITSALTYFSGSGTAAPIYLAFVIGLLSLYPSSILIIIFLKPVQDKMKAFMKSINRSLRDHRSSVTGMSFKKTIPSVNTSSCVQYHRYT